MGLGTHALSFGGTIQVKRQGMNRILQQFLAGGVNKLMTFDPCQITKAITDHNDFEMGPTLGWIAVQMRVVCNFQPAGVELTQQGVQAFLNHPCILAKPIRKAKKATFHEKIWLIARGAKLRNERPVSMGSAGGCEHSPQVDTILQSSAMNGYRGLRL